MRIIHSLSLLIVLLLVSCDKTIPVTSIALNKEEITLKEGESFSLTASVSPSDATDKSVNWSSSNTAIAQVSQNGLVQAMKEGVARITANCSDRSAVCVVIVKQAIAPVSSLTLDQTSLLMRRNEQTQLTATIIPSEATTSHTIFWQSSDPTVATVDNGLVTAIEQGNATITAEADGKSATCAITVSDAPLNAVDLGLSVQWAPFNVGANKPEEFGDYYAWGETEPKSDYSWSTYKWCDGNYDNLTKYNINSLFGAVDYKVFLDLSDDPACMSWNESWRMPTEPEMTELQTKCTWTWTTQNGNKGYRVTGPNGNSIFLPAAGHRDGTNLKSPGSFGFYWYSSLHKDGPHLASALGFGSSNYNQYGYDRYEGFSVRPVFSNSSASVRVESVFLSKTNLGLNVGNTASLVATVRPENAECKDVIWSSSNESVASVSSGGVVTAVAVGSAVITVTTADGGKTASCKVTVTAAVPEAIDLGLPSGVKWASFNVGASKPEEYGDYFAWGETEPKSDYSKSTYKWYDENNDCLTKYNKSNTYGAVDYRVFLDLSDDAARANWGGSWRMPTITEQKELINNCTQTWITLNGKKGVRLTSNQNGNSIFLPAAGRYYDRGLEDEGIWGEYWSSSLNRNYNSYFAETIAVASGSYVIGGFNRYFGIPVRPVLSASSPIRVNSVSLNKTNLGLNIGNTSTLVATVLPTNAECKDVIWSSSNESVASVSSGGVVTAVAVGSAVITVTTADGGKTASCKVTVTAAIPEAIDLGLPSGVKWASFNVGASKPEEYGDYFAWGETEPKSDYSWKTYKWCSENSYSMTKYNSVDNKTSLDLSDDAARANWGGSWRMPTDEEMTELRTKCNWTITTLNGKSGIRVTGPNGNSIFLPAAGNRDGTLRYWGGFSGDYWSSSLRDPDRAWTLYLYSLVVCDVRRLSDYRFYGFSVRPVSK